VSLDVLSLDVYPLLCVLMFTPHLACPLLCLLMFVPHLVCPLLCLLMFVPHLVCPLDPFTLDFCYYILLCADDFLRVYKEVAPILIRVTSDPTSRLPGPQNTQASKQLDKNHLKHCHTNHPKQTSQAPATTNLNQEHSREHPQQGPHIPAHTFIS